MSQPQPYEHHELGPRLPITRSRSESPTEERSTTSHSAVPTERVQIKVTGYKNESLDNVEKTLKRGLEARQVSLRLARCVK